MKNKIVALSLIINIVLIGIVYNLLNPNERLAGEKQILKEMSTSEREQELDNKITELNNSATEYATYVQSCKTQIANAITERGVSTNETDTIDVMVENIKKLGELELTKATSTSNIESSNMSGSFTINKPEGVTYAILVIAETSLMGDAVITASGEGTLTRLVNNSLLLTSTCCGHMVVYSVVASSAASTITIKYSTTYEGWHAYRASLLY